MFEAAGVTIGLAPELVPASALTAPPAVPDARISTVVPLSGRTDAQLAALLQRIVALEAELAAFKTEAVVELAARRPNCLDVPAGAPGAANQDFTAPDPADQLLDDEQISEFFADELALILNCSRAEATRLSGWAHLLHSTLADTWAALADGRLDWPRARAIAAELLEPAPLTHPAIIAAVQATALPRAGELSIPALRALIRRELLARDSALADARRRAAEKLADVTVRRRADGLDELVADLPRPVATDVRDAVDTYARLLKQSGDPRPIGVLRAAVLTDLVLRPWDPRREPVTATVHLTVPLEALEPHCAPLGDRAPVADLDGHPDHRRTGPRAARTPRRPAPRRPAGPGQRRADRRPSRPRHRPAARQHHPNRAAPHRPRLPHPPGEHRRHQRHRGRPQQPGQQRGRVRCRRG